MKTPLVVAIVVGVHCLAVGSIVLIQGCGTTRSPAPVSSGVEPRMPPRAADVTEPRYTPPVVERKSVKSVKPLPAVTTTYIVGKGDSLSVLAKRFNLKVSEIMALNHISNPDMIRSGQTLILPGKVDVSAPVPQPKEARPKPKADGNVYVIKRGDSLSKIAADFGTTVNAIKEANGLKDNRIYAGKEIIIPGRRSEAKPSAAPAVIGKPVLETDEPEEDEVDESGFEDIETAVEPTGAQIMPETAGNTDNSLPVHVVAPGEDLYSVAMKWSVSVDELKELNGLTTTELKAGDRLSIPVAEW
jgi:LysM repeat protein